MQQLNRDIDRLLSVIEDVPEGIAKQFREIDIEDRETFRRAVNHPLWRAHKVRDAAAETKDSLALVLRHTGEWRIKRAILAVQHSGNLRVALGDYADADNGRRIIDIREWSFRSTVLPGLVARFAVCLVDAQ